MLNVLITWFVFLFLCVYWCSCYTWIYSIATGQWALRCISRSRWYIPFSTQYDEPGQCARRCMCQRPCVGKATQEIIVYNHCESRAGNTYKTGSTHLLK